MKPNTKRITIETDDEPLVYEVTRKLGDDREVFGRPRSDDWDGYEYDYRLVSGEPQDAECCGAEAIRVASREWEAERRDCTQEDWGDREGHRW